MRRFSIRTVVRAVALFLFPPMPPAAPRIHAARTALLFSLMAVAWCGASRTESSRLGRSFRDADLILGSMRLEPAPREVPARVSPKPRPPTRYDGAPAWCEPAMPRPCAVDADCTPDAGGRTTRCVRPYWAKGDRKDERVCAAKWPTKRAREEMAERVRATARHLCPRRKDCDALADVLAAVGMRESTLRPWKAHRLNGDVRAARAVHARRTAELQRAGNCHAGDADRWGTLGLYGMNAALWIDEVDATAPPEILCRVPDATIAYVRRLQRAQRKIANGIDCDGDGKRERVQASWARLHDAASGGDLCGRSNGRSLRGVLRALKSDVNVDSPVAERQLGRPIPGELAERLAAIDALARESTAPPS